MRLVIVCLGFLFGCYMPTALAYLRLDGRSINRLRSLPFEAPKISMRPASQRHITVSCTTPESRDRFAVMITCPLLSTPCYENCIPTKPCSGRNDVDCVPDGQSVNCTQGKSGDGRIITTLWIDKRDKRMSGAWECTKAGKNSGTVDIISDEGSRPVIPASPTTRNPSIDLPSPQPVEAVQPSVDRSAPDTSKEVQAEPPVFAFASILSQSPWVFVIVTIFAVSLTVNIILWIRWCLVCIYTQRRLKNPNESKGLGTMLCLPTEAHTKHSDLWEPEIYPHAAISEGFQNQACLDSDALSNPSNFQRFGTFGPTSNFSYFDLPPSQTSRQEFAFPAFNTIQPDQMWHGRASTFSPRRRLSRGSLRSPPGSVRHLTASPMTQPLIDSGHCSPRRFPRVDMNASTHSPSTTLVLPPPPPPQTTVYDDVASSSTITMVSRNARSKVPVTCAPQLPSMAEFATPIYTLHAPSSTSRHRMETFGVHDTNDGDILNS